MPTDQEWQEFLEVVEPMAEQVDQKYVEEQADGEDQDTPAEDEKSSEEETQPVFKAFATEKEFKEFLDSTFKERFDRANKKHEREKEEAERQAAQAALEKNQEFEELYRTEQRRAEKLQQRISELETAEEARDRYHGTLKQYADQRMEKLPEHVKELLSDWEPDRQLAYLNKHEEELFVPKTRIPAGETPENELPPEVDESAKAQEA